MAIFARLCLVLCFCALARAQYKIPDVTIQALAPKGIRVSIPDAPKISLFTFNGNINSDIAENDIGVITGEVLQATNGRWVYEDLSVQLKVGDVINYYVFVSVDSVGYLKDKLSFRVDALEDPSNDSGNTPTICFPTATKVRGGIACAGQTIFEDNFDRLNEDVWQIQHFIPRSHPEFPFVSYQRLPDNATVSVADGQLRIKPVLLQNLPGFKEEDIYSGTLNLFSSCTTGSNECYMDATGANILPPVVTGRISSQWFSFKYGTVHIRAKLPKGDWIYPEILLEPFRKRYGNLNYASGVIKMATARGNTYLTHNGLDIGNKVLYGGPIMSATCRKQMLFEKRSSNSQGWSDDFHEYSMTWTPDRITLSVDAEEWAWVSVKPATNGLRSSFTNCTDVPQTLLALGSKMAPFDDFFSITLGMTAGGVTEFEDGVLSSGRVKPWRNSGAKAMLHFWQDMNSWYSTWKNSVLIVDYVKVVAL